MLALSSSKQSFQISRDDYDLIFHVTGVQHRIRSKDAEYVTLEMSPCDPSDPNIDPLVIKLGDHDAVHVLWRDQLWKLVDGSAMSILSVMVGAAAITEGKIDESIKQLMKILRQRYGQADSS